MKFLLSLVCLCALQLAAFGQSCWENSKIARPEMSAEARKTAETRLAEAKAAYDRNPNDADAMVWYGRRTAYLGDFREAVRIFRDGAKKFPQDARFYRHSGHRLITLRCFDEAIHDLEDAVKRSKGKPDSSELDGQPSNRPASTATLHFNIWYHLGLAYYLKGNFKKALAAYEACEKTSPDAEVQVSTGNWHYMTLRRLGRKAEAEKVIAKIADGLDIRENAAYYRLIKLYQGKLKPDDLINETGSGGAVLYGLGNWYLYNGKKAEAEAIFRKLVAGNQITGFAYIAAEAELQRK